MNGKTNSFATSGGGSIAGEYYWEKYSTTDLKFIELVFSDNSSEYPTNGVQDGFIYVYKGNFTPSKQAVAWSTAPDYLIVNMVALADAGKLNLSDYWSVGDKRSISLPAMAATNVGETHAAQTVTLILLNEGGKTLTTGSECNFIVGLQNVLNEKGYMNASYTVGTDTWDNSARRKWCNNEFKNAMLSTSIGPIFKQHQNITATTWAGNTLTTSTDWFALPAAKEVIGGNPTKTGQPMGYSNPVEFEALTQFKYYEMVNNRIKYCNGSTTIWWERSPFYNGNGYGEFCNISTDGSVGWGSSTSTNYGISPFGCI